MKRIVKESLRVLIARHYKGSVVYQAHVAVDELTTPKPRVK